MAVSDRSTTAAYVRVHGKAPKGHGSWAFQASTGRYAFFGDLQDEPKFYYGTYPEARRQALRELDSPFVATLP